MFKRILVPLDGSTYAERAIAHAEQFARIFGANIILLRVLETTARDEDPVSVNPLNWQIRKAEADMYLQEVALRIQNHLLGLKQGIKGEGRPADRVEYAIREGRAAENIVNFAHSQKIDLVIISTHGASGLSRWNISSVTRKVMDRIYLPVLLIRAYESVDLEEAGSGYQKILLPIDCSRRAEYVFSTGIALAEGEAQRELASELDAHAAPDSSSRVKLILATVIKPLELPIPEPYPEKIQQLYDQLMHASRESVVGYLNELKERISMGCEIKVIENDNVLSAIQELVDREDIDMVLMSAHGYGGQISSPYGSVTRGYIEQGTRSLLIIQDVPGSLVQPTAAEVAAEKFGGR